MFRLKPLTLGILSSQRQEGAPPVSPFAYPLDADTAEMATLGFEPMALSMGSQKGSVIMVTPGDFHLHAAAAAGIATGANTPIDVSSYAVAFEVELFVEDGELDPITGSVQYASRAEIYDDVNSPTNLLLPGIDMAGDGITTLTIQDHDLLVSPPPGNILHTETLPGNSTRLGVLLQQDAVPRIWRDDVELFLEDALTWDMPTFDMVLTVAQFDDMDPVNVGNTASGQFITDPAEFTTSFPINSKTIIGTDVPWTPEQSTVVFSSSPIAGDTGYAAMSLITNLSPGVNELTSSGTGQKICQTEPHSPSIGWGTSKRVVEFHYNPAEFVSANAATNFFYIGNPVEGEYEQVSPTWPALQAGSVVGLVCQHASGNVWVYVDGVYSSLVNLETITLVNEMHVGFTTNGTCSVVCVTDGASMAYPESYGAGLDDWQGNQLS